MLRKLLYATAALGTLVAAFRYAVDLRAREDARALAGEAELVLRIPLRRVPELAKLDAPRALALLEQARSIRDEPRTRALQAWARALDEYQKGRNDAAARALQQARRGLPASADLAAFAAAVAVQAGQNDEAERWVERALALD